MHPDLHGACVVVYARLVWVELPVRGPRFDGCGQFSEFCLLIDEIVIEFDLAHRSAAIRQEVLIVLEVVEVAEGGLLGFFVE